jgi:hypothetical protein
MLHPGNFSAKIRAFKLSILLPDNISYEIMEIVCSLKVQER